MEDTRLLKRNAAENEKAIPDREKDPAGRGTEQKSSDVSETWAEETIADLDDFIESQGIYIRQ
ncbi:MAG: hypothetical protein Q4C61_14510 [Lachnospiraceae bacterium]|nr:hypothetical protein [Lachnospiraceae bacterium]